MFAVGEVMVGGCLGHSDHELVELKTFGVRKKKVSRVATLDFKRADFSGSQLAVSPGNQM